MKKKHYVKDISDIKYCEENGKTLFSDIENAYYEFSDGVWSSFDADDDLLRSYNDSICLDTNCYYYEESEEPMQEATEEDVGKLCLFKSKTEIHYKVSILQKIVHYRGFDMYETEWGDRFGCCRRLSPAEVSEITGYKLEEE